MTTMPIRFTTTKLAATLVAFLALAATIGVPLHATTFTAHCNFCKTTVATPPSPCTSGTTLIVSAGDGAKFGSTFPMIATVWPAGAEATTSNSEIVLITGRSTDTLTITRTQEGTAARCVVAGDQIDNSITVKVITDIETVVAGTTEATTTATGNQDDFATGFTFVAGKTFTLRANNASLVTFRGFAGGVDGAVLEVLSVGAGEVDLAHENANSTAAYRETNMTTSGVTPLAAGVGRARFVYDGTSSRWKLVAHEQGYWITPSYDGSRFTASTGSWTVDSGDISEERYWLRGRRVDVELSMTSTTVSATPSTLRYTLPNSYTFSSAATPYAIFFNLYNQSLYVVGETEVIASQSPKVYFWQTGYGGAWSASTNATNLFANFSVAVN